MDSNRSLIVLAVGTMVVLAVLLGLLPLLVQGIRPGTAEILSQRTVDDDFLAEYDRAEAPRRARAPAVRRARFAPSVSEDWVPRNQAERRWFLAREGRRSRHEEYQRERATLASAREFLESSAGGDLQTAFELLRRGQAEEAAALLETVLPELEQQPIEVQQPLLGSAARLFKQAGREKLLAKTLDHYLKNMAAQLQDGGLTGRVKGAQAELLEQVREHRAELRRVAGSLL